MEAKALPMKGGDGTYSYTKNSSFQREAVNIVKEMIKEAIADKFDLTTLSSNTIRIADLGCSSGPNTFLAMENIIKAIETKYLSQALPSITMPDFEVLFNDHSSNDFNTLFTSLPPNKPYFTAGVPGSFHGRLFPKSSLHVVHSAYAIHWLSRIPEALLDRESPAWNKGRIHYGSASEEVARAYAIQFAKDMASFLDARAEEVVGGGLMILVLSSQQDHDHFSDLPAGRLFSVMEQSLLEMVKAGSIREAEVDSFNLPVYACSPKEMKEAVERNGLFSIERMEIKDPMSHVAEPPDVQAIVKCLRAGFETTLTQHFGATIIDELFERIQSKSAEISARLLSNLSRGTQLFVVLRRK
ncbi:Loganate O-methyltransferase [Bertholletia excelsa]